MRSALHALHPHMSALHDEWQDSVRGPNTVANLTAWYRSDLGITLNGSTVSAWADQSGNGNNVSQAVGANQPAYSASGGVNNRPKLTFSGASGVVLSNTTKNMFAAGAARTVYSVVGLPGAGGSIITFKLSTPLATFQTYLLNGIAYVYSDGVTVNNTQAAMPSAGFHIIKHVYDGIGALQYFVDGAQKAVSGGNTTSDTGATSGFFVGGRADVSTQNWAGDIYEMIVYAGAVSAADDAAVMGYLQARYGQS